MVLIHKLNLFIFIACTTKILHFKIFWHYLINASKWPGKLRKMINVASNPDESIIFGERGCVIYIKSGLRKKKTKLIKITKKIKSEKIFLFIICMKWLKMRLIRLNMNEGGYRTQGESGNWPESLPRSPVHQCYDNVAKKTHFSTKRGIFGMFQLFCIW